MADGRGAGGNAPRVAILGAGLMGRWHADTARRLGARVVGVADPDPARARALAARHPGAIAFPEAEAVLSRDLVDIAHICSPLPTHAPLAAAAIERGIHALVEKPLAASAEETRRLLDLARAAGVILCPVHQMGFQDGATRAAAALGTLGPVSRISFDICSAGGAGRPADALDEITADILPHPLSILRRLWPGAPLEAARWCMHHPSAGELLISGAHAGALLSISISMNARPTCFEMAVQCHKGSLRLDLFHGFALVRGGGVSRLRKAMRPFTDAGGSFAAAAANLCRRGLRGEAAYPGLRELTRGFYAAVRTGGPWPIPPCDAIAVAAARDDILARMAAGGTEGSAGAGAVPAAVAGRHAVDHRDRAAAGTLQHLGS